MEERITRAEFERRLRENSNSEAMFKSEVGEPKIFQGAMHEASKFDQEVPQFWILPRNRMGYLGDPQGYWTEEARRQMAFDMLDDGVTVTFSNAALQSPERIRTVQRYWVDAKRDAERNLQSHAEANPTGCPVGCEQCANLLREYDATLSPSEHAAAWRDRARQRQALAAAEEKAGIEKLRLKLAISVGRQDRFKQLQAEWIDIQVQMPERMPEDRRREVHGRWLFNLSDVDKRIWDEFVNEDNSPMDQPNN